MGFAIFFSLLMSLCTYVVLATANTTCSIQYLYQIGDSLADTGNGMRIPTAGPNYPAARLPYGETFPGKPTGRWSDGRLIIDFTAMALGLPLLSPYLDTNASFIDGVNFAIAGSVALSPIFLASRGIIVPANTPSLSDQVGSFTTYMASICSTPQDRANRLKKSLIFLGEIGGNDINAAIAQNQSIQQIRALVPFVNQAIANATRQIIKLGAQQIVVPGNFPVGCVPYLMSVRASNDTSAYDELGCVRSLNDIASYQNTNLQLTLNSLRLEFPKVKIIYSDYYNSFLWVLRNVAFLGFNTSTLFQACCGKAVYNFTGFCGTPGVPLCPNPNTYIFWDGIHLTENAYRRISQILIRDIFLKINCLK